MVRKGSLPPSLLEEMLKGLLLQVLQSGEAAGKRYKSATNGITLPPNPASDFLSISVLLCVCVCVERSKEFPGLTCEKQK